MPHLSIRDNSRRHKLCAIWWLCSADWIGVGVWVCQARDAHRSVGSVRVGRLHATYTLFLSLSFVLFSLSNSDTVWPIQMKIKKYIYITAYWIHRKRMPLGVVLYACMCYAYSVAFELSIFSALCMREKRNNTRDTHTHTCTKYSGLRETVALLGSDRRSCRGEHIVEFSTLSQSKVEICGCLFVSN